MFTPKATASHRTRGNLALMFGEYLERWKLTPDGEPIATQTSAGSVARFTRHAQNSRLSGRRSSAAY
jgi:hypothetical protein